MIVLCDPRGLLPPHLTATLTARGYRVCDDPRRVRHSPVNLYVTDMDTAARLLSVTPGGRLPRVLVVTDRADSQVLREAVAMGAIGLASADNDQADVVTAITRVMAGHPYFDARLLRATLPGPGGLSAEEARRIADRLTSREWDVLEFLVRGASTDQIADDLGVTTPTVRSHIHKILSKLGVRSRLEAAAFALTHQMRPPKR